LLLSLREFFNSLFSFLVRGTGSYPPLEKGLHRKIRHPANREALKKLNF